MNRAVKYVSRSGSSDPMLWVSGAWTPWVRGGVVVVASMMVGSVFLLIWNASGEGQADGLGGVGVVELMVVSDESSRGGVADEKWGGGGSVDRVMLARYDLGGGEIGRTISKPAVIPDAVEVRMARRELTLDSVLRAKHAAFGVGGQAELAALAALADMREGELADVREGALADVREVDVAKVGPVVDVVESAKSAESVKPAEFANPGEFAKPGEARATVVEGAGPTYDGRPLRKVKTVKMKVTAYSPDEQSCGIWADGITASGYSVWTNGMKLVAADTKYFKFGTILTVPGYHDGKPVPVLDRGGKIKGHRLDVLYPSHEIALKWGVKELEVDVWEYAD